MAPKAIFKSETFAISGKLAQPQKAYEELIRAWGGTFSSSVSAAVTCLVTNEADAKAVPTPVKVALALARGVPLVNEGFLGACISAKKLLDHEKFVIHGLRKRKAKAVGAAKGAKAPAKKAKTTGAVGTSPTSKVLERSGLADKAMVVKESVTKAFGEASLTWDVELVLTDDDGRDKFYNMQLLVNTPHTEFWAVQHQGWTGLKGRVHVDGPFPDVDAAKRVFRRRYRQKTGNVFGLCGGTFEEVDGKYRLLAAEDDEEEEGEMAGEAPAAAEASAGVKRDKKAEGPAVWQYYLHNEVDGKAVGWYNYEGESVENIEKFWRQSKNNDGLDVRVIRSDYFTYEVNYKLMLQTNLKSGTRRVIRRLHPGEKPSAEAPAVIPDKVKPKKLLAPEEEEDDEEAAADDDEDDEDYEPEDDASDAGAPAAPAAPTAPAAASSRAGAAPAEADEPPAGGGRCAPAAEPAPAGGGRADPAHASGGRSAPAAAAGGRSAPAADDAETDDDAEPEPPAGGRSAPAPAPAASLRGAAPDDAETVPAFDEALAETLPLPTARR